MVVANIAKDKEREERERDQRVVRDEWVNGTFGVINVIRILSHTVRVVNDLGLRDCVQHARM